MRPDTLRLAPMTSLLAQAGPSVDAQLQPRSGRLL
jgi:hypothetical protein